MKLAIVGSRNFKDYNLLSNCVDILCKAFNVIEIISGGAAGADTLAERYAKKNKIPIKIFYPEWKKYGLKAGYIRNKLIIERANYVIAFPLDDSKGTWITINLAKNKIPTWIIQEGKSNFYSIK